MDNLASVIVLSYNGRDYLRACLSSLLASDYRNCKIIVVDNASLDGSAAMVQEDFPQARLVSNPDNLGFAGGMNRGIAQARGAFLAFLNQDTTVRSDWLGSLVVALAEDQEVGLVGSKIFYPDGRTLQHAGGIVRYPQALADHYGYRQVDEGQCDQVRDVDYVTGAAFATRREVLDRIGLFDESFYPAYFEDTDLCFRAREAGYRVIYVPQAVVFHHESATTVRDSYEYLLTYHTSRLRFILKHYSAKQIQEDFYPVEQQYLAMVSSGDQRQALSRAYETASSLAAGDLGSLFVRLAESSSGEPQAQAVGPATSRARGGVWGWLRGLAVR